MYNFVVEYRKITSINKYSLEKKVFEVATKVKHVTKGGLLICKKCFSLKKFLGLFVNETSY